MKRPDLPVYYYHDHFVELLWFVRTTYGSILTAEHDAFVARFQSFTTDAQCLLIRMVNRRGAIFNRLLFRYPEISDVQRAADDLLAGGQARRLSEGDYAAFVACLSKDVLLAGARAAGCTDTRVSWPKAKLIDYVLSQIPFHAAAEHCRAANFIALDDVRPLEFLLYLYFGKTERDLKTFALRDLGIVRTNGVTSFKARFTDGEEARACFHYSHLLDRLDVKSADVYRSAVAEILGGPDCATDYAADLRSRAACRVGLFFEKLGEKELAKKLYRAGSSPECHERLVRLLYAAGHKTEAEELLRRMIDDPASDGEFEFATDYHARKFSGRRTGTCTELLRAGVVLTVDDLHRGNPEAGVAGVMRRKGYRVFFAENTRSPSSRCANAERPNCRHRYETESPHRHFTDFRRDNLVRLANGGQTMRNYLKALAGNLYQMSQSCMDLGTSSRLRAISKDVDETVDRQPDLPTRVTGPHEGHSGKP